jgi:transposase
MTRILAIYSCFVFRVSCFVFRVRRGDLLKIIWWNTQGARLFMKRLEKGRFVWPAAKDGKICVTTAQLSMLLEGVDWRTPART